MGYGAFSRVLWKVLPRLWKDSADVLHWLQWAHVGFCSGNSDYVEGLGHELRATPGLNFDK